MEHQTIVATTVMNKLAYRFTCYRLDFALVLQELEVILKCV